MVAVDIRIEGDRGIKLGLEALAHPKMPFLEDTLRQAAQIFGDEVRKRAPGGIKKTVRAGYVRSKGNMILATVSVSHPGGRPLELGRHVYYRGFHGNNRPGSPRAKGSMKRGRAFQSFPGERAKPYIGIRKGDAAIAASQERVTQLFNEAVLAEWEKTHTGGL